MRSSASPPWARDAQQQGDEQDVKAAMQTLERATHLVVMQHGLHGSEKDFAMFERILWEHLGDERVHLHIGESNAVSFFQTYDGVDQGGERLADEIQALAGRMPSLSKLSLIGHSLGGLYARYAIGVLFARGFFENVEPMNFITLATPHLGIRRPRRGTANFLYNSLLPNMFSRTGQQLSLNDSSSELTQSLSIKSNVCFDKEFHPAWDEMEGLLLANLQELDNEDISMETSSEEPFTVFHCVLKNRRLEIFKHAEHKAKAEIEIDLFRASVQVMLPGDRGDAPRNGKSNGGVGFYASILGWGSSNANEDAVSSSGASTLSDGHVDIRIRWPVSPSGQIKSQETGVNLCVLRIPEEKMARDWKWVVALSNASFGLRCVTASSSATTAAPQELGSPPPLLSALTRGQFMQALQLFKARSLYSNIFFDMQVPYSCAAVRAFNPYRLDEKATTTSPIYRHLSLRSVRRVRRVRDTVPAQTKRLALEYVMSKRAVLPPPSPSSPLPRERRQSDPEDTSRSNNLPQVSGPPKSASAPQKIGELQGPTRHERRKTVGSAPSDVSASSGGASRPEPFVDGEVVLDQLQSAFTSDPEKDELRGMLLSVQSVGWRRVDALFGSVMAHEHIIAKRASLDKPMNSGVDIVHHVMDTFML